MERYDYLQHIKSDVLDHIKDCGFDKEINPSTREYFETSLTQDLHESPVTGLCEYEPYYEEAPSYTDEWQAEEYFCHNSHLFREAAKEFGLDPYAFLEREGFRQADVAIRCYLLPKAIHEVLDEMCGVTYPEQSQFMYS